MNDTLQPTATPSARQASAREFFAIVFRRKALILGLLLATTATVIVIALTTPVIYESTGHVLIKRGEQQSMLTPGRQLFNDWESDLASEVEMARGYPVIQRAREVLKRESNGHPPPLVNRQFEVEVMGKSNVLAIAYQDRDPKVAQRVCDALIRAYIEYRQNLATLSYPKTFFERELGQVEHDLQRWVELRRTYVLERGAVDLESQTRNLLNLQTDLQRRRSELSADLAEARTTVDAMRALKDRPEVDIPLLTNSGQGDALMGIKTRVLELETRVAQLRERYRDDTPEVVNAEATLQALQEMLRRGVDTRLELAESRIRALEAAIAVMDRDIAVASGKLSGVPDREAAVTRMDHEIEMLRKRSEELVKNSDQAKVIQSTSSSITVLLLSPASAARSKTTRDYIRLGLAPAFSLVVGIGLAFFVDGLDVTVRTSGQAEEAVELPVLAALNERRRTG